ncbi:hypothetical protein [Streptomyces sp. NBC_00989]|uniref:hypothetical protein n=1 Tax=Streptomyces sp. NBC_00989 TaxID=2903705 RepID=UPI00386FB7E6
MLDLRPVSFIDCAGLGVPCRTRKRVRARSNPLRRRDDIVEAWIGSGRVDRDRGRGMVVGLVTAHGARRTAPT